MTRIPNEPTDSRPLASLSQLGRDVVEPPTKAELDRGLNVLRARIATNTDPRRTLTRWGAMGAVGAVAVLSIWVAVRVTSTYRFRPEPTLTYQIDGGSILEGGYLREAAHSGIQLSFNEGSRFVLLPGTRGRLRAVDNDGARLAIENGTASFQITKSAHRHWFVEVGPFLVAVKGTVFGVSWDPSSERFELRLQEGRVVVSGPVSGGDLTLRTGQRLVVNLAKAETLITEDLTSQVSSASANPSVVPPIESSPKSDAALIHDHPAAASNTPAGPSTIALPPNVAGSTAPKVEGERRWADDLARGHWDQILEDVDRVGVAPTLDAVSSADLSALADAARYRHRLDLARAALLAQRRRFPSSARAIDAIYLLGRVEESRPSGLVQALSYYDEYLTRAPAGTYAAEALGRKMTVTNQTGGAVKARPIAEEYLRRFPSGSYAGSARALLRVP